MSTILAVAGVKVRRFLRDRSNIFFVFIFPLLLILLLGSQFGAASGQPHVSLAGGAGTELEQRLVSQLTGCVKRFWPHGDGYFWPHLVTRRGVGIIGHPPARTPSPFVSSGLLCPVGRVRPGRLPSPPFGLFSWKMTSRSLSLIDGRQWRP